MHTVVALLSNLGEKIVSIGLDADDSVRIGGGANTSTRVVIDNVGNITATSNVLTYSDARLKKNVVQIENALEKVKSLKRRYIY